MVVIFVRELYIFPSLELFGILADFCMQSVFDVWLGCVYIVHW